MMSNKKQPMQAGGGGQNVGQNPRPGVTGGGESGGGAYPNPHGGKAPKDGLLSHGGQTEIEQKAPGKRLGQVGKG
jgi:hypothetical protein